MAQTSKIILGIGGAHIDRRGQVAGDFISGASNPGTMGEDVGGGTFNALRNAVQRGTDGWMMSVRGGDAAGETVARAIAAAGIRDLSTTFLDRRTPSYTALLDRHGEVIAALADMGLYDLAFGKQLRRASVREAADRADAILCDANLGADALARLPSLAVGKPLFAVAISPAKAVRLTGVLGDLHCLFLNAREARALARAPDASTAPELVTALRALGLRRAVLSQGSEPLVAYDEHGIVSLLPPVPARIVDVTGAGDALAGATIAALLAGLPLAEAIRHGTAAAFLALVSSDPVPRLSTGAFEDALALVPRALPETTETGAFHAA